MSFIKSYGDMWFFISHWIRGADSKICSIRRAISHLHFVIQRESLLSFSYSHISDTFHESISHINDQYIFFIYWYRPLPKMQTRNAAWGPQIVRTLWIKKKGFKNADFRQSEHVCIDDTYRVSIRHIDDTYRIEYIKRYRALINTFST